MGQLIHNLRGHAPPADDVVRKLEDVSDRLRLTWTPFVRERLIARPGENVKMLGRVICLPTWWLWEIRPTDRGDAARRIMGAHRLQRLAKRDARLQEYRPFDVWETEAIVDGLYPAGRNHYAEDAEHFGSAQFFYELIKLHEDALREDRRLAIEAQRAHDTGMEIDAEINENPKFASFVRDVAKDFYFSVSGGVQIPADGYKGGSDVSTDRERVAGSGHGQGGQPDERPAGHGDGGRRFGPLGKTEQQAATARASDEIGRTKIAVRDLGHESQDKKSTPELRAKAKLALEQLARNEYSREDGGRAAIVASLKRFGVGPEQFKPAPVDAGQEE